MDSPRNTTAINRDCKRLFEEKYNTITQKETMEEKAVFQNNYIKYLKTKVFYKLPSKCGS